MVEYVNKMTEAVRDKVEFAIEFKWGVYARWEYFEEMFPTINNFLMEDNKPHNYHVLIYNNEPIQNFYEIYEEHLDRYFGFYMLTTDQRLPR